MEVKTGVALTTLNAQLVTKDNQYVLKVRNQFCWFLSDFDSACLKLSLSLPTYRVIVLFVQAGTESPQASSGDAADIPASKRHKPDQTPTDSRNPQFYTWGSLDVQDFVQHLGKVTSQL